MGRYQKKLLPNRLSPADHDHVEQALEKLDISALAGHPISELSGGQRQRAFIAQALARDASLLLLDEPITGLDFSSQEIIMRVIEQTRQAGGTVVLSTHHLDEARHADQVAVLATTLVAAGAPDAVLCPDVLRQAYGARLLGDHSEHDHRHEMLLIDDHGHGHHEN
jgi:zinc/manganese transport system ATP-binding protein